MAKFKVKWLCEKHDSPYRFRTKYNNSLYQSKWSIETLYYNWYDETSDTWISNLDDNVNLDKIYSCMCKCKSFKSVLRRFKKWSLPKGTIFYIKGRYVDEEIVITIK